MPSNKDADEIAALFRSIPAAVKRAIQPALEQGADELVDRMRYLAPDEDGTGTLRASIEKEDGPRELSIRVAAGGTATTDAKGDDYALNQEYGTAKMERNSFFWPSVNSAGKRVRRRVDRAIGKAIKDHYK